MLNKTAHTVIRELREENAFTSTRNACKLCAPLGASVVFQGIRGCVPMLHGSQGCATYIRRYLISHFREPVDIASSNFSEESTIFGGSRNFSTGIENVIGQYHPEVIGIASTCLSETIGEDIDGLITTFSSMKAQTGLPYFVHASTPSYSGTHMDGYRATVLAAVKTLAGDNGPGGHINLISGFISPADIRQMKEILSAFAAEFVLFPDYSETLDGTQWEDYQLIPEGGTPVEEMAKMGTAKVTLELGLGLPGEHTAGNWLFKNYHIPCIQLPLPVGIKQTDKLMDALSEITGNKVPEKFLNQRGRLVDAYVDAHKYVFGKRAIVYGEEEMVASIVAFLAETGVRTVLAGSGSRGNRLEKMIKNLLPDVPEDMHIMNSLDFEHLHDMARELQPDLFIGNSKGYYIARDLKKPLVRIGFPVHDRFGGQRLQLTGYAGTQHLFDQLVNVLIEYKQASSPVGYKYI